MLDFLIVSTRSTKRDLIDIYPRFLTYSKNSRSSKDLMIRGGDFYAIWIEEDGLWSTDEQDALRLIDKEIDIYYEENKNKFEGSNIRVLHMWDSESGMIDIWHKYCQRQLRDSFHMLDETLIFSNTKTSREDYASKRLSYPLENCNIDGYEKLMSTLYSEEERLKIEWAIGSIVSGDSKKIQKFLVLYGASGTGKSTVLNIVQQLFDGYYTVFDAKALGSSNNSFALEAFKSNPLVAIQHDGDLSRIEDNTRLNSLVSHELMTVNEKFKSAYSNRFKCFLFMGTNKPVKITDAKSGLIRRLIDVTPTGKTLKFKEYTSCMDKIKFELGGIASHCLDVYMENPHRYDNYIPTSMLGASNDFYNFILESFFIFKKNDSTTLKSSWEMYKTYCDEAKVPYPYSQRIFKEELKNYFEEFKDRYTTEDGERVRNYYSRFKTDIFDSPSSNQTESESETSWIKLKEQHSILDDILSECPAQYASDKETPLRKWSDVSSTLADIDSKKLHYVKVPNNHIVIDFDICDSNGIKQFDKNLEAASKWPSTYVELSKSGEGIHLHYIYTGDISKLSRIYDEHIEIKVFTGNSSLRRKLTKCNDIPVASICSGLPLKGESKTLDVKQIKSEKSLRNLIKRNLNKEFLPGTKPSMDFLVKILDDAYESDLRYDVSDMRPMIFSFAAGSTNHADYCIQLIDKLHFKSKDRAIEKETKPDHLVFYDVEVFPNLLVVCWKIEGSNMPIYSIINPTVAEIEQLISFNLVGFNCRRYDNHILYARLIGYSNEQIYKLSQQIINNGTGFFGEAYNLSYTDIYDFCSKKQSLKKWEIELGIHHQELGLPWDKNVDKKLWNKVADYCKNDVIATETLFNKRQADFTARKILAELANGSVNDTTNTLTAKIIFGNNKKPQDQFNYRFMGVKIDKPDDEIEYTMFDDKGRPLFPNYIFDAGKSTYRGENVGEGGYVYSEPGMYGDLALLDVASMHPSSIVDENLFGEEYTSRFNDILQARIAIKHGDFETARSMLDGKLAPYLVDEESASDLAAALKIAINSVYGLTSAKFDNPFRDIRNVDNIVAKRGALFMINLKHEVQKRGYSIVNISGTTIDQNYQVAHIKTDSIKIPDATPEIIQFVMDYGKKYGYTFEHEATYDRMCLVNDAVYICKFKDPESCLNMYGYIPEKNAKKGGKWDATGTQFQVPYVFKTLFSKEPIEFKDLCETKSVQSALYLDMNEDLPDVTVQEKEFSKLESMYKEGKLSDVEFEERCQELNPEIEEGHDYRFIGKVGQFCPIKSGCGGGLLMRYNNGKYYAVTGTKGFRWLESEMVKNIGKEKDIDIHYYEELANNAIETISKYGDYEWFVSEDPYVSLPEFMRIDPNSDEEKGTPFD